MAKKKAQAAAPVESTGLEPAAPSPVKPAKKKVAKKVVAPVTVADPAPLAEVPAPPAKKVAPPLQTEASCESLQPVVLPEIHVPPLPPVSNEVAARIEAATQRIGTDLWNQMDRRQPSVFDRRWWLDRILNWAMQDESVKVQMFRFVDVLPMLKSSEAVGRHLQEYFQEVQSHLPLAVRLGLEVAEPDSLLGKALAMNARINARKMAERFIAGTKTEDIFLSLTRLRKKGLAFTLDLLGEAVISEPEAEAYQQAYLKLIESLHPQVQTWPEDSVLDRDDRGHLPRCQVSLKLSALCSHFKPMDPERTATEVKARLRPILRLAQANDTHVHVDMEHFAYKDLTLQIFQEILLEPEFRNWADCGIVVQAYLPEAGDDLHKLRVWAEQRGTPVTIRLVKGAYWDYETMQAEYKGWPCPVYQHKWESDANFERQTRYLMEHRRWLRPAIASHNLRSLAHAMAWAEELNVPPSGWEIQMLYGMAEGQQHLFSEQGYRVRVYAPFGEMLPGMAYLVRRLLENTSNDSFLRHAYQRNARVEELLQAPTGAV